MAHVFQMLIVAARLLLAAHDIQQPESHERMLRVEAVSIGNNKEALSTGR